MLPVIKELLIVGVSIITALLVMFGVLPERAIAPNTPVGAETPAVSKNSPSTNAESEAKAGTGAASDGVADNPLIDDYAKSLQEALDALEQLQNSKPAIKPIDDLNGTVRESVVNVLCTTSGSGPLNPISASGVIIDSRGVILTNAHVAQYLLLKDYPRPGFIECIARTGSPAKPAYMLDLLFISPSWITENAHKIDDETPTGNGEHDYALLVVTGFVAAPGIAVPDEFPHLSVALRAPNVDMPVLLAAYPAGFLGGITIQKDLYAVSANARVARLYTFDTNSADLFSIGGSIVAQQGASGGAVTREDGVLTGLITTSSDAETTGERDLRALSTEYIIRDFESESGWTLADYLGADLNQQRQLFWFTTAPALAQQLVDVLKR